MFHYSGGIHPWYIVENKIEEDFIHLKKAMNNDQFVAVGECGLDRLCDVDFKLQEKVFIRHIELANSIAKPIIIHCVRAFPETLKLLRDFKVNVPVIFHGFHSRLSVAMDIIEQGYYLSFGESLFKPYGEVVFSGIPPQSFFLETDNSNYSIYEIYNQACRIKNIPLENLHLQLHKNTRNVFPKFAP